MKKSTRNILLALGGVVALIAHLNSKTPPVVAGKDEQKQRRPPLPTPIRAPAAARAS